MKLPVILFACLAAAFLPCQGERYEELFPESHPVSGGILEQTGISKLKVGFIFDVYVAAFYQPAELGPADVLGDHPKHLELYYLRNISREDFIEAADDMLSKQHSVETIGKIQPGLDRINPLYQDVSKGDRYSLTYLPGIGTELKFNGATAGIIPGADFARIYFSIWLGENMPYKKFRDRLVGL